MEEISRPKIIDVLQEKIEELKQKRANLQQNKRARPDDLNNLKSHIENDIQETFANRYAKAMFLQCMLQEPPVLVTSSGLEAGRQVNQIKKRTLEDSLMRIDRFKRTIHDIEENIAKEEKNVALVEQELGETLEKEREVKRIKLELSGQEQTIDECKDVLAQQSTKIINVTQVVDERQEIVEDYLWKIHKVKRNVEALKKKAEEKMEKAQMIQKLNTERDKGTEEQYHIYRDATDLIKKVTGVESIEYESSSLLYVTCNNAVIHIHIDLVNDRISDAYVAGSEIRIIDLVNALKGINVNDALSILILETVARLRK